MFLSPNDVCACFCCCHSLLALLTCHPPPPPLFFSSAVRFTFQLSVRTLSAISADLLGVLISLDMGDVSPALVQLSVGCVADILYLTEADLMAAGVVRLRARRLLIAAKRRVADGGGKVSRRLSSASAL